MSEIDPALDYEHQVAAWAQVAATRLALIEQLKAEKRQLAHEVDRLQAQGVPDTATRVVVIKNSGIVTETFANQWRAYVQDDGRTVKLFGYGDGAEASAARGAALGAELAELTKWRYCRDCGGAFPDSHDCGRKQQ